MKKRILALALAVAITMGLGNSALAEVLPESIPASPEISAQPEDSASPEVTGTPEETIIPEVTQAPQETTTPEVTQAPEETTTTEVTATPEATTAPVEDEGNEDSVQAPILEEPYALPGVENFVVTQAAPEVTPRTELPSGEIPYQHRLVNGVSPSGTTIDLFDYWLTEQTDSDNSNPSDMQNKGINGKHALLFGSGMPDNNGNWNAWTGNSSPRTGIVSQTLGEDGYPKLSGQNQGYVGRDGDESLAYLFDPEMEHAGKASYPDVQGLLQVDSDGYYYYNSQTNYAVYYEDTNSFALYNLPGVVPGGNSPVGQFFPFNEATTEGEWIQVDNDWRQVVNDSKSNDSTMNHYFGVHMSTRFVQQYHGHTDKTETTAVTYKFSGDDDVWIFIDGVLVADLGGIHDAASVSINFATGRITINGVQQGKTLGQILGKGTNTLPDNTYHTLDFFYLERGNVDSNMNLKYNLVTIPESSLIKVDQIGDPVPGAKFTLYSVDDRTNPIATGTTDADGEFVFLDNEGFPITIQRLYEQYGEGKPLGESSLVLVETVTPAGYRTNGDIELYFYHTAENEVLLLSNSVWDKGAYAMSKVTATTPNTIQLLKSGSNTEVEKEEITLVGSNAVENPLMFAVVYQKQSDGTTWLPVSGDPINGWTVEPNSTWASVLNAARNNPYIFQLASSGAYQVEVENLPGDIKTYYHVCGDMSKAQYTIGYYYTTATTLGGATAENTRRINSDPTASGAEKYALMRVFSMDLYVTNIKNRLLVQKVDDDGNAVNGAVFSLYQKNNVALSDDGTVTIDQGNEPYDQLTTAQLSGLVEMDGGGVFPTTGKVLEAGEYYLVETSAPGGYKLNDTVIPVVVDNTGVYVDAGKADDGVSVLRGVGSVIRSMVQFAAGDDVDTTLHNIKADLANGVWYDPEKKQMNWQEADWTEEADKEYVLHLEFANEGGQLDYGPNETGGKLAIEITEGWSKLLIRQCTEHKSNSGNYTNLGDRDITNLFSGTVTVRVKNDRIGNLKISKTVTAENNNAPDDDEFSFTVTVAGASGTYKTVNTNGKRGTITFTEGTATETVTLRNGENFTILGLPWGATYTVTETQKPGYTPSITVKGDTTAKRDGATVTGTIQHNTSEADAVTLTYTNTYKEIQTLTVTKTVDGNMGDTTKDFTFTLQVTDTSDAPYTGTMTTTKSGTGVVKPEEGTIASGETFTLAHGQQIAIDIPKGYTATVTETAVDGYTTTADLDKADYTFPENGGYAVTTEMDADHTVDYLNECDMTVPPSGVDAQNPGISVMMGVAAISAVLIFGCSFLVWRRRRRDWM